MLRVKFADSKTARSVHLALSPDNVNLPKSLSIKQRLQGRTLQINVDVVGGPNPIETLISTLDEFVAHIQTATVMLDKVEQTRDRHSHLEGEPRKSKGQPRKAKYG